MCGASAKDWTNVSYMQWKYSTDYTIYPAPQLLLILSRYYGKILYGIIVQITEHM